MRLSVLICKDFNDLLVYHQVLAAAVRSVMQISVYVCDPATWGVLLTNTENRRGTRALSFDKDVGQYEAGVQQ